MSTKKKEKPALHILKSTWRIGKFCKGELNLSTVLFPERRSFMNKNSHILRVLFLTLIALNLISVRRILEKSLHELTKVSHVPNTSLLDLTKE